MQPAPSKRTTLVLADMSLVAICLIWGTSFAIVKSVVDDIDPASFIAVRFAVAAVLIGLFGFKHIRGMQRKAWAYGLALSIPLFAGFILQVYGIAGTTASKAGFITGMYVAFTPFLDWVVFKRRIGKYQFAGVCIALAGLAMLALHGSIIPEVGDLLVLACSLGFAVHIIMLGHYSPMVDGFQLAFAQMVWVTLLSVLAAGHRIVEVASFSREIASAAIYLGALATGLAYLVQTLAQKYTPPTRAALIFQLEPVFSAIFAYLWAGEVMTRRQFVGAAMILLGVMVCQYGDMRLPREM